MAMWVGLASKMSGGGDRKERFEDDAAQRAADTFSTVVFWLWVALALLCFVVALVLAARCGGGWRQFLPAVLDPWVYIILRIANPC